MTIEDQFTSACVARADRPVDADALLAATLAAGRARARRRHGAYAVSGAGAAGVVAAALVLTGGPAAVSDRPPVGGDGMPTLPVVAGAEGAATRPDLVGTDPAVLRFGVPWAPFPVQSVSWSTRDEVEEIDVQMSAGNVGLSGRVRLWRGERPDVLDNEAVPNATSSVAVGGRPAVLTEERFDWGMNRWVTWHPEPGLTAQVGLVASGFTMEPGDETPDRSSTVQVADLTAFADAVRLDTTTACTAPFRLAPQPPGGELLACTGGVMLGDQGEESRQGDLLVAFGNRKIGVTYLTGMAEPGDATLPPTATPEPDFTTGTPAPGDASGSPDVVPTGGPTGGTELGEEEGALIVSSNSRTLRPGLLAMVGYEMGDSSPPQGGAELATAVTEGLTPAGDPDDPSTWPRRPLG